MSIIKDAKTSNGWKIHMEQFNSADEVVKTCRTRVITDDRFHNMQTMDLDEDFHSVKTYDEALTFMRTGYQPIVDEMSKDLKATVRGEARRFGFSNSVHGFAPVVPLALKGVPNSMINMTMRPIKAKVIDVYYESTFLCSVSNAKIIECGKKMLSAILALEQQGYRFNLYAVQIYSRDQKGDMLVVKVKSAEQPVDLKRISVPIAHPAFFRVIGFDWYSKMPGATFRHGYGGAIGMDEKELIDFGKDLFGKNAILFTGENILKKNEESIKEVITNGKCKA